MTVLSFLLGLFVMAAYWPGIIGAPTTPRWIALSVGCSLLLFLADRITVTAAHVAGLIFIAWCALTLLWSADVDEGVWQLLQIVGIVAAFALGSATVSLRGIYAGCAVGIAASSVIVIAQHLGLFAALPHYYYFGGLFYNANAMGEAAALVIVACVATRLWTGALVCLPALVLSGSRAAMLGVALAGAAWLWSNHLRMTLVVLSVLVSILGAGYVLVVGVNDASLNHRLAIWSDTSRNITLTGHGLGSYWETFPKIAKATNISHERPARAHNEVLDIAFETGIIAAALFLVFALTLSGPLSPERMILIALAVEAMLGFPFRAPATAFIGGVVAGRAARDRGRVVDQVGAGRDRLRLWLARRSADAGVG